MLKKLVLILVLILFFANNTFAYFEYKYYCVINSDNISVSLSKKDNYKKCMDLIKDIDQKIYDIDDNISIADKYIKKNWDKEYWLWVKEDLTKKKNNLNFLDAKIKSSMILFENSLFVKVKKVLDYYLTKELLNVSANILLVHDKISEAKRLSDGDKLKENIKIMEERVVKKYLLEWILNSDDFEQMVPLLKNRLAVYKKIN